MYISVDWAGLEARTVEAPILPELHGGDTDVSNFDAEFTDRSSVQGDLVTRSYILLSSYITILELYQVDTEGVHQLLQQIHRRLRWLHLHEHQLRRLILILHAD